MNRTNPAMPSESKQSKITSTIQHKSGREKMICNRMQKDIKKGCKMHQKHLVGDITICDGLTGARNDTL